MEYIGAEVSHKIRSAIKAKLMELGAYVDEELPDYIMVMVANKRSKAQMDGDLQLFLGSNTSHFTSWLYQVLQKLQEVTVGNLDKKSSKISSSIMKENSSTKRKSSGTDNESHRKEKRRKSAESKKLKKSDNDTPGDSKKDISGAVKLSSKLSDTEKYSRSHNTKEYVTSSRLDNSDSVVSSSADSRMSRKSIVKEKAEKVQDTDNIKRNFLKSTLSNGSTKSEEKNYLSHLRAEALRSRDERVSSLKSPESLDNSRLHVSSEDRKDGKITGGKLSYVQGHPSRAKIILMHSDDEDDDEDFINIKADAEAEQLLKEELPREVLEISVSASDSNPDVEKRLEEKLKAPEILTELPTIPLKENLVPKRPSAKETVAVSNPEATISLPSVPLNLPSVPVSSRLLRKRGADPEENTKETKIVVKEENKSTNLTPNIKDRLGVKKSATLPIEKELKLTERQGTKIVSSEQKTNLSHKQSNEDTDMVPKKTQARSNLLSQVVMLRNEVRTERPERRNRVLESKAIKREVDEEEEYDPSNPAVGTVASVVRVKPRPKLPPALQANKNLILKAVAEAQKSVASAPIRTEPSKPTGLWKRTSSGIVRKHENNVGVTLPNRHLNDTNEGEVKDVKLDSTRVVSSGDRLDKIIITVSSSNTEKGQEVSQLEGISDVNTPNILQYQEEDLIASDGVSHSGRAVYPPVGLASRMPRERSMQQQYSSPQFLVTLDGLDPNMFGTRSTSLEGQSATNEDYDLENVESTSVENDAPKKTKIPIVYKVEATADDSNELSTLPKSLERCKYWPSCRLGTKCNFHHPVTPCKTFPKCPFGDKCLYIHPFCKFNSACTRRDCPFVHAAPRVLVSSVPQSSMLPKACTPICRFFPKCSNLNCKFLHPKACRYGKFCSKQDCNFIHQDLPPVDKLKWTSPFKT